MPGIKIIVNELRPTIFYIFQIFRQFYFTTRIYYDINSMLCHLEYNEKRIVFLMCYVATFNIYLFLDAVTFYTPSDEIYTQLLSKTV